jgi:hypothetical protein
VARPCRGAAKRLRRNSSTRGDGGSSHPAASPSVASERREVLVAKPVVVPGGSRACSAPLTMVCHRMPRASGEPCLAPETRTLQPPRRCRIRRVSRQKSTFNSECATARPSRTTDEDRVREQAREVADARWPCSFCREVPLRPTSAAPRHETTDARAPRRWRSRRAGTVAGTSPHSMPTSRVGFRRSQAQPLTSDRPGRER